MRDFLWGVLCVLISLPTFAQETEKSYKKTVRQYRKEYKKEFEEHPNAPLSKKDFKHLAFYGPDRSFKVECEFVRLEKEAPFEMATYAGTTQPYRKYGVIRFEIEGEPYELAVYQNLRLLRMPQYKDYLFIPFKDLTNGESTYGGGRYLDISQKDILNDSLTLDFNLAYNPYCAYKDGYQCPIPPAENHLEVAIEAGEKEFGGEKGEPKK